MADLLCLIPARGGSKGIPGKNTRFLNGKPLIWYAIENARRAGLSPVVSSDDPVILDTARGIGADTVEREASLAADDTPLWKVCQHHSEGRAVLCLPPTTPFLRPETIRAVLDKFLEREGRTAVFTVAPMPAHSSLAMPKDSNPPCFWRTPIYPRQSRPAELYPSGAAFLRSAIVLDDPYGINCFGDHWDIVETTPLEALNIDTEWDFELCEALLKVGNPTSSSTSKQNYAARVSAIRS